jgi:hypothetical protein
MQVEKLPVSIDPRTAVAYRELSFLAELTCEARAIISKLHTISDDFRVGFDLAFNSASYPPHGIILIIRAEESTIAKLKSVANTQTQFNHGTITISFIPCSPNMSIPDWGCQSS